MSKLYSDELAGVYDKIYQGFIDYKAEYTFYAGICKKYKANSVLELACGSGNLAKSFSESFEDYLGLDFSKPMLNLARQKYPEGNFRQGDMRNFKLPNKYDAALITGRSTSYLLLDNDLERTFASISKVVQESSLLIFDCIYANKFIPYIKQNPAVIHEHHTDGIRYFRKTNWSKNKDGKERLIDWTSSYFKDNGVEVEIIGNDFSIFRVFKIEEIKSLLAKIGFQVLDISERKTYAFDTFVVVAKYKANLY